MRARQQQLRLSEGTGSRLYAVAVSVFNSGQQQDKAVSESPSAAASLDRGHGQQAAEGLGGRGVVGALAGSRSPLHAVVPTGAPRRRLQKVGAPGVGKARARGRDLLRHRGTRHAGTQPGLRDSIGVQGSDQDIVQIEGLVVISFGERTGRPRVLARDRCVKTPWRHRCACMSRRGFPPRSRTLWNMEAIRPRRNQSRIVSCP